MQSELKTAFEFVTFNEDEHSYTIAGQPAKSATDLVKQVTPPFPREEMAQKKAAQQGRSVDEVLAEWDAKGERGRKLGTRVHQYVANALRGSNRADKILALNERLAEEESFDAFWTRAQHELDVCAIELVVGDSGLQMAGTLDALFYHKADGTYHLFDWKTGRFSLDNRWSNLLPPMDDLEASDLEKYSLQASLYRLMVERNTSLELGDSYLVHLSKAGHFIYKVKDYRQRLIDWVG